VGRGRHVAANHLLNFQYETRGPPRVRQPDACIRSRTCVSYP
jgi:hypothetical protein